ncbi:hypothetical protein NQ315_005648 [Exocentrus adspersus]|uniref:DNA-directed DNA polymerase n=1 Tax=Exocentrus adspersus TaxID=1586481 RepID=A0AAV8V6Y7_9CUCU|nr:hypothetical protein NQ315_005648 [Exocentrus adspersus]
MALSKLPKAFELEDNYKKGYFPHLFNTSANQNYVGPLPHIEFYGPDTLKEDDRKKLIEWHTELTNNNYVFDFQKEIVEYCISDVEILAAASLKFGQQMLETGNVCPFTEACTIASACNKVYRRNFLQPNTIGIIPKGGYRWGDNQSKIAIQWLVWMEKERNINIVMCRQAARSSSCQGQGRRVRSDRSQDSDILGIILFKFGNVNSGVSSNRTQSVLFVCAKPSSASQHSAESERRLLRRSHRQHLRILQMQGWGENQILPPQHLYHPILPAKMNNKLMFVLCRTCGEKMNQGKCHHTEEERALTETWVIDEVKKALEMGYRMLKVHEVWSYEIDQFNKATKKGGLFTSMMNRFVAVKQQASGWPQYCRTDEEKNRYIEEFLEREDVKLEFAEIVEKPVLRSLAKLILNSF